MATSLSTHSKPETVQGTILSCQKNGIACIYRPPCRLIGCFTASDIVSARAGESGAGMADRLQGYMGGSDFVTLGWSRSPEALNAWGLVAVFSRTKWARDTMLESPNWS